MPRRLGEFLRDRQMLLVIDTFEHVQRGAPAPDAPAQQRARALIAGATMPHWQGDDAKAEPWEREATEQARATGDEWATALGLGLLVVVAEDTGGFDDALAPPEQALTTATRGAFPATVAIMMDHLGVIALGEKTSPEGNRLLEQGSGNSPGDW